MHTVSVVTLLLGSIFAYSLASPQFYGSNLAGLSTALAQLASQLAAQERNETIKVGNNSVIVSGISSATANVNTDRHNRPHFNNNNNGFYNGFYNGYYNGYYNNYGYNGLWRGVPEEDNLSEEEAALAEEEKEMDALSAEANQELPEDDEDVDQDDEQEEEHDEEQDKGHEEEQDEGHEEEQEQPQEH